MKKRLVLLGGGGHASDVLGVIESMNDESLEVVGILDDGEVDEATFAARGVQQIGDLSDCARIDATHFISAVGWPKTRAKIAGVGLRAGLEPLTVIAPTAVVGRGVSIGPGTVVRAHACISPMARLGAHVFVGQLVAIGHHTLVGSFVSVMPGAAVSGQVTIGEEATIGTNAAVIQGLTVAPGATLGAGATATKNLELAVAYVGSPALPLSKNAEG